MFLLDILEKMALNMFVKVFSDDKLMMAWLYINKLETIFMYSHDRFQTMSIIVIVPFCVYACIGIYIYIYIIKCIYAFYDSILLNRYNINCVL